MSPPSSSRAISAGKNPTAGLYARWRWLLSFAIIIALIAVVRYLGLQDSLKQALDWVGTLGVWGPAMFTAIYIVAAVFLVPGSVLTLGAGALFGLFRGTVIASVASTLAATCAFLIGRYVARDAVTRRFDRNPRFASIDRAVAAQGWKIVLLTRLLPVFPYALLNYAFGLTSVKLRHFVLASWLGMLPGTVMYVYLGTLARAGAGEQVRTPGEWVLYGVGLLAAVLVALLATRIARRALAKRVTE